MPVKLSYCRLCPASCGVRVEVDGDRILGIVGDGLHPLSGGYSCPKGRRGGDFHQGPDRLTTSMRRTPGGNFEPIPVEVAIAEIAERLEAITGEHGPDALALFMGTQQNFAALTGPMARAWFRTTGSRKLFSTMTIDQSAKWIVQSRMGEYLGGRQRFDTADVWLLAGTNPMVSLNGGDGDGAITQNPSVTIRRARERGLKLIVVDPRRTETAVRADLHLQLRPGTDAALFAGLLHVILSEGCHDHGFCERFADGLEELGAAVAPATPAHTEAVTGVPAADVIRAARMFAAGRRGMATTGTGVCMGPHSNVAEHLAACLNVVCGRYLREGEVTPNRNVLARTTPLKAEVRPPYRTWESGFRSRIGGIGTMNGELPSGILADEILEPGADRVRALVVSGGNPARALPDREKVERALSELELLVCVDTRMSDTARLADYVIAPTMAYERPDHTLLMEFFFARPFAQYTPRLVAPPAGVIEDWEFFFRLASAAGHTVKFAGRVLDPDVPPTSDEMLAMFAERGRVSMDEVMSARRGTLAPPEEKVVGPPAEGASEHRLALCPDDVSAEIAAALGESTPERGLTMRLTVRRMRELMNSVGRDVSGLARFGYNPAHVNPQDLRQLGIEHGDIVRIRSAHGRIRAVAHTDPTVRQGTVSMTHCWGASDADADPRGVGSNVNDLTGYDRVQNINAMPVMTAVPVAVESEVPAGAH
ncbi:molybdopterin-containing oxidoreductase family protein [Rhodococcus aetherivorans]|uniref:molybdopterin-containing oxidoreductase family protein n=1 Tax=Rhodococcus aetherivorans TaxID=191292 RepID=UPI001E3BA318|nr:molybdopterin-dependent oxidoreductase [Rhodococcus aetherivorans]UGQ40341.1 molybdopterin-dependent oxidoreductase [Rhodococcus aetherivorans]